MLQRVKLTNFGRHRDLEVRFNPGLTALRGPNEAGKSTTLLAVAYALFGAKALKAPIEETVTWGEPVASLKVELDIAVDGVQYSIRRGKSGAEINYPGGKVTGQTETVKFLCDRLRVDQSSAVKLILSNQAELRGALEAGTKATTDLIERLAEFDQIDQLIERMQEGLTLGNTASAENALQTARESLLRHADLQEPDWAALDATIAHASEASHKAQARLDALESDRAAADNAVDAARTAENNYRQAVQRCDDLRAQLERVSHDRELAHRQAQEAAAGLRPKATLEAEIEQLKQAPEHLKVWERLEKVAGVAPTHQIEGTYESARERLARLEASVKSLTAHVWELRKNISVWEAAVTTGTCSVCGQDFSHLPEVAAKNAETAGKIKQAEADLAALNVEVDGAKALVDTLKYVVRQTEHSATLLEGNPGYLGVSDLTLVPPTLVWIGPDVRALKDATQTLRELKAELARVEAEDRARTAAQARAEQLAQQVETLGAQWTSAVAAAEALVERPSVTAATAQRDAVLERRRPLQQAASDAQVALRDAEYALRDARRAHKDACTQKDQAQAAVERLEGDLKSLVFNNALLKRVRQARPIIADQLWTIVLNAVSVYFSEMRGVKSTVTKDVDGFKVDDHAIATLSGSTLDILGLAIRVALVRTFLPNSPFLVLDEPSAAMDETRTQAMLGFLAGCGQKQIILVTHEDVSESVADHMIQL